MKKMAVLIVVAVSAIVSSCQSPVDSESNSSTFAERYVRSTGISVAAQTTGDQKIARVKSVGSGSTMVLWKDVYRGAFYVQVLNSNGAKRFASELYVGNDVLDVAFDRLGNFVVSERRTVSGNRSDVWVSYYGPTGIQKIAPFKVNTWQSLTPIQAIVNTSADGRFVVGMSYFDGLYNAVTVRVLSSSGQILKTIESPFASYKKMAIDDIVFQSANTIAFTVSGTFQQSSSPTSETCDVRLYRYDVSNSPYYLNVSIVHPEYRNDIQWNSSLHVDVQGRLLVTWESWGNYGTGWAVFRRWFDQSGTATTASQLVSRTISTTQMWHRVDLKENGDTVFVWLQTPSGGSTSAIVKEYFYSGQSEGPETVVAGVNQYPFVAIDNAGNYTVCYDQSVAGAGFDVRANLYTLNSAFPVTTLNPGLPASNLQASAGSWLYYKISVPTGISRLNVNLSGPATSNADLYLRLGGIPYSNQYDIADTQPGSTVGWAIGSPPPGDFYVAIFAKTAFSGVTLSASY